MKTEEAIRLYAVGQAKIARAYNVSPMTVSRVVNNQSWRSA